MRGRMQADGYATAAANSNRRKLLEQVRRWGWLYRIRPQSLAEPLYRLVRADNGRAIIDVDGVRLYVDPLTTHGMEIVAGLGYERDLIDLINTKLPPGGGLSSISARTRASSLRPRRELSDGMAW